MVVHLGEATVESVRPYGGRRCIAVWKVLEILKGSTLRSYPSNQDLPLYGSELQWATKIHGRQNPTGLPCRASAWSSEFLLMHSYYYLVVAAAKGVKALLILFGQHLCKVAQSVECLPK